MSGCSFVLFDVAMDIFLGNFNLERSVTYKKLLSHGQQAFPEGHNG